MKLGAFCPPRLGLIVVSAPHLSDYRIVSTIGFAWDLVVRSRRIGGNILSGLRTIPGGEITEYTQMLNQARYDSSDIHQTMSEILAYRTALIIQKDDSQPQALSLK
jgi:uncharacterized protein YbjQ (UPF0145 family)